MARANCYEVDDATGVWTDVQAATKDRWMSLLVNQPAVGPREPQIFPQKIW